MSDRRSSGLPRAAAAWFLAVAGALLCASALGSDSTPTYVGPESCRKCHAVEFERWRASAHALGTRAASTDSLPPEAARGATVEHPPGRTEFSRDGTRFFATTPLDDGKPSKQTVDLVVGVKRLKMLVTHMPDGRWQVLPPMREEPGGAWFDYTHLLFGPTGSAATAPAPVVKPGEPSFWTGPDRSFDARCARCHTSGYEVRPTPPGARGARSSWRALGVDCEACHGPASRHVDLWTDPPAAPAAEPLVRLKSLPRERALDVCLVCHLEGEPVDAGYRLGDDLVEHVEPTLVDNDIRVDPTGRPLELVYEGVSFLASTCAGAGKLRCLDCHDAHGSPNRSALAAPVTRSRSLCAACHAAIVADPSKHSHHDPAAVGSDCVACHMPLVTIERGHGAVHDHTIGVPRPSKDGRDACSWCHLGGRGAPPDSPQLERKEISTSFRDWWPDAKRRPAWSAAIAAGREGRPDAGPALRKLVADPATPRIVRASAAKLLGKAGRAAEELPFLASDRDSLVRRRALEGLAAVPGDDADHALMTGLSDPSLAVRTAAARAALEGYVRVQANDRLLEAILPVLAEDARAVPEDHMRWFRLGSARRIAGDDRGALDAFERKLQLDPGARLVRDVVEDLKKRLAK
jgi:predicted CXXCH cytochrome family protein